MVPTLANSLCVRLRDPVAAHGLEYEVAAFVLDVFGVQVLVLPKVQLQEAMPIPVGFMAAAVLVLAVGGVHDGPCYAGAGVQDVQTGRPVNVGPEVLRILRRKAGRHSASQQETSGPPRG